jgi:glycosyltransferase involved in cell wall biosynthesis
MGRVAENMKLVFAYDVVLAKDETTGQYHHESFHYDFWRRRYHPVFHNIVFGTRVYHNLLLAQPKETKLQVEGRGVKVLPLERINSPLHYYTRRPWGKQAFREALSGPSALIARLPSEIGIMAIQTAIEMDKPWMVEMVGHPFDSMWHNGSWYGKIYAPWNSYRIRAICKKAPFVSYVTQEYLQSHYPTGGRTLDCSDAELVPITDEEFELRFQSSRDLGRPIRVGLIGTLATKYKGLETAFRALSGLTRNFHVELDILGGGNPEPWRKMVSELGVEDHVSFSGILPSGRPVREWLDGLDLYIQPSLTEGLPRALLEAMSRGIPCIASDVGGVPELLPRKRLMIAKDDRGLAERMGVLIRDENERRQSGFEDLVKARDYTEQRLSAKRIGFLAEFREYATNRLRING